MGYVWLEANAVREASNIFSHLLHVTNFTSFGYITYNTKVMFAKISAYVQCQSARISYGEF